MGRLVAVSTPPSASWLRKGKCKFVVATRCQLSWESRVSLSNKLLYGTTHPQTWNRLDINTRSEAIVTFIMDQLTKKRPDVGGTEKKKKGD